MQQHVGEVSSIAHESFDGALDGEVARPRGSTRSRASRSPPTRSAASGSRSAGSGRSSNRRSTRSPTSASSRSSRSAVWRISEGAISPGDVVQAMALFTLLAFPMRVVGFLLEEMPRAVVATERLDRVLAAPIAAPPHDHARPARKPRPRSIVAGAGLLVPDRRPGARRPRPHDRPPARSSRSSGRPAAARAPCASCSSGSTPRIAGPSGPRPGSGPAPARGAARSPRARVPGVVRLRRHRRRERPRRHRSRTGPPRNGARGRPGRPVRRDRSRPASTPSSASGASPCRAANASGSRSPAPSPGDLSSSSSTMRPPPSTRGSRRGSSPRSATSCG